MSLTALKNLKHISSGYALCLFLIMSLSTLKANSQTAGTANIQGVVTDQSGAVLPNAAVVVTNTATLVKHTTVTDADGLYSFPNLAIGNYSIDVSAPNFQHYRRTNIVLEVGSSININVTLTIGAPSQQVEVHANGMALQTEDASFKQTIDQAAITELPLNGRQVTSLIVLSGGSAPAPINDIQGSKTFYSSVVVSVAGGMGNQTDYRYDGADNNDYMTNINLPFPFPDALSQFSVETAALGAQSGLHPGGLVNVVTKSGTSTLHGDVFEYIRNNAIDATNFFSTNKDTLHQNQFGATLGGPIIQNKLFFFGGYQYTRSDQSQASQEAYVPTPANLQGDFSVTDGPTCEANGSSVQLLNPLTGAVLSDDHIDPSYFVAPALALQKYLPATTNSCGLVSYAIPLDENDYQIVGRIDSTINEKHSLYGRYFIENYTSPAFFSPTNLLVTTQSGQYERSQSLTLGETDIINLRTVNSFHATGTRLAVTRGGAATGIGPSTIGIDMYAPLSNFLQLTVTNKWSPYCGTCVRAFNNLNTYSFADDVTMTRGKNQIALGGEFVRSQFNTASPYMENGVFGFTGVYSEYGPAGTSPGGTGADANLDFLTGALNTFQQSMEAQWAMRATIPSLYVQDAYHATGRLVISGGVRWDPEFMPADFFRRGGEFRYNNFLDNIHSVVYPNAPAGILYYGDAGVQPELTTNSPWQFSPRFGIAFDPRGTGKTVFRVGAGLLYDEPNLYTGSKIFNDAPWETSITNTAVGVPLSFASPWSNGSGAGASFPLPSRPSMNTTFPHGGSYASLAAHFHAPYSIQWTASVQREFGRGWQFQIDYIGNVSRFNPYGDSLNPAVYIPGTCNGSPCSTTGNEASRFALTIANPAQGPMFAGGATGMLLITSGANASYGGMVATIQHRLSSTFSVLANYTLSHCLDIEDAQGDISNATVEDPSDIELDRGNCGTDYRDIFNSTVVADSHFNFHGWRDQAFNNWEIAPLVHITDGTPFTVTSGVDNSLTDVKNDRPNLVSSSAVYTRQSIRAGAAYRQYVNASAFAQNLTGTYGDVGRNSLRGPKFVQLDAELSRMFLIKEKLKLDFRIEAFNALNHPALSTPESSLVSPTFGQISSTTTYGARVFQAACKVIF